MAENPNLASVLLELQKRMSTKDDENGKFKLLKYQREWFMDMLTSYISVPTLIVGFYGMNLLIPGERSPLSLLLVVTLIVLWVFYVWSNVQGKYPYPTSLSVNT